MPTHLLKDNRTLQILERAEKGRYGVLAAIIYNIEQLLGVIKAAESCRSPLIIQLFPWAISFSAGLLVHTAYMAARKASVPVAVHLDHCQDEAMVRFAADNLPFDSIMVDMSHHGKSVNLRKTSELSAYCHSRGIAVEAELGRIEGGEDGIADTSDLEGLFTTPEDLHDFASANIDILAPAIGNVHGEYGPKGPQLHYERLQTISHICAKLGIRVALHGTNSFSEETMQKCIQGGVSKVNVNKLTLDDYNMHLQASAATLPLTKLMEAGVEKTQILHEVWMRRCGSAGKA